MPLTLRLVKGSELTYAELDGNFTFITSSFLPLSVTSSMSVATASNVTPAIANNADNRIITSDGDGTFTAEANFTFNGTSALITGSLTVTGSTNLIGNSLITGSQSLTGAITASAGITTSGGINATGGFTGSLLGTATTASNITPAVASDGVNRVLTSDGDGTVTAEASLTFDGSALLVTGSATITGSNALTTIGAARFRSGTANSAIVTALEITGGLQVSASIDSVNRFLYNSSSAVTVEWQNGKLNHPTLGTSVDWISYLLKRSSGITTVNWDNTSLYDYSGGVSVDWGGRQLADTSGITSIHWGNRYALYSSGLNAFEWGTPGKINASGSVTITGSLLVSGSGTLTNIGPARFRGNISNSTTVTAVEINVSTRMSGSLVVSGSLRAGVDGNPAIDTTVGTLSNGPRTSVDWLNKQLKDSSPVRSVDWENRSLYNTAENASVNWESGVLYDSVTSQSVDWESRALVDSNGTSIFNWDTKRFRYSNSNSLLNFETPGTATIFVSASFYVSASGLADATASLSIQTEPNVSDWYTIALRSRNAVATSSIELNKYITITHGAGGSIDMIGDTYFTPGQAVRIYNNTGNAVVQIDPSTVLTSTLTVAGNTKFASNVEITGSLSISGSQASVIIMPKVSQSLNFVDDTAAAAAGVPKGGLYRNGSFIMIRVS